MAKEDTVKLTFRVPVTLADEINKYALAAGLNRSSFLAIAAAIGARALARQLSPETFLTPELIAKMKEAGFAGALTDEN